MRFKDYPEIEQILMVVAIAVAGLCILLIPGAVIALQAVD